MSLCMTTNLFQLVEKSDAVIEFYCGQTPYIRLSCHEHNPFLSMLSKNKLNFFVAKCIENAEKMESKNTNIYLT